MLLSKNKQKGFTLVELVSCIVLLSILSITAYSKMPSRSSFEVAALCNQTQSALRRVQVQAMNDVVIELQDQYQVNVSATLVQWQKGASSALNSSVDCVGVSCSNLVNSGGSIEFDLDQGGASQLKFDGLGRPSDLQSHTISFKESGTVQKSLSINQEGFIDGCV
ncbi:pilus assembly FimT family protein [Aliivibrio wodanis]|uniref:pilus assembly FimT family protein n=1 Tax=Aliivibrio wodanis TaxID=80852 RepID=UPI00406D18A4